MGYLWVTELNAVYVSSFTVFSASTWFEYTSTMRKSEPKCVVSMCRLTAPVLPGGAVVLWDQKGLHPQAAPGHESLTEPSGLCFPHRTKMGHWAVAGRLHRVSLPPQPPVPLLPTCVVWPPELLADDTPALLQAGLAHDGLQLVEPGEPRPLQTEQVRC